MPLGAAAPAVIHAAPVDVGTPSTIKRHARAWPPEEVWALVRAADSEPDAPIFLSAAFTGRPCA